MYFNQIEYDLRCEWGMQGIQQLAETSDAIVIVDVISFTTCVDAALSRGARVYPYQWKDESLLQFAQARNAIPAVASRQDLQGFSLSPTSLLRLPDHAQIVLASPNGATLSLATGDTPTFAGCLRNARAVAAAAAALGQRVSVIPAGERWHDNALRPGIEDLLGAGAILYGLPGRRSPEAEAAVGAFLHLREHLSDTLANCSSGKEAIDRGRPEDIQFAADLNASLIAPRLINGAYQKSYFG